MSKMYKVSRERPRSFRKSKLASARCILHYLFGAKISEVTTATMRRKKFIITDEENRFAGRSFRDYMATIYAGIS